MANERSPISGLTENEAKELHGGFMMMTIIYVAIAVVAHYFMWIWRPWFPGTPGYKATSSLDGITTVVTSLLT
jgi:light-harvesting complex 1 beta chain